LVPEEPPPPPPPPPSSSRVDAVAVLPEQRSFRKSEPAPAPPKVVVNVPRPSEPAPPPEPKAVTMGGDPPNPPLTAPPRPPPPPDPPSEPRISEPPSKQRSSATPPKVLVPADHVALGDALRGAGDMEAALAAYKRALAMLGSGATLERAEI